MKKTAVVVLALLVPAFVMGDGEEKKAHKEAKGHVLKAICVVTPLSKSKVHGVIKFKIGRASCRERV